jgi:hypothetical protein
LETLRAVPSTGDELDKLGGTVFTGGPVTMLLTSVVAVELPTELEAFTTAWMVISTSAATGV